MIDKILYEMVCRSVDEFNEWRKANPKKHVAFAGANFNEARLEGADFKGINFAEASFICARLTDADFSDSNLGGVDFASAFCNNTNFTRSNVAEANFYAAFLKGAKFEGTNLWLAQIVYANGLTREVLDWTLEALKDTIKISDAS